MMLTKQFFVSRMWWPPAERYMSHHAYNVLITVGKWKSKVTFSGITGPTALIRPTAIPRTWRVSSFMVDPILHLHSFSSRRHGGTSDRRLTLKTRDSFPPAPAHAYEN